MRAFIEEYLDEVLEQLGDPGTTKRTTSASLIQRLNAEMIPVFEELLRVSGSQSKIGYTETTIALKQDVEYYDFPGGFRKFLAFEKRTNGDPTKVTARLFTKDVYSDSRGILIKSPERGFQVWPPPGASTAGTWTLRYQARPVRLHYAEITAATQVPGRVAPIGHADFIIVPATLPAAQGEIVLRPSYYKGQLIRILDADPTAAAGQVIEVSDSSITADGNLQLTLRRNMSPVPTGMLKYEIVPMLPEGYTKVFSVSVALSMMPERTDIEKHALLRKERRKWMRAARNYFRTTTQDRVPQRQSYGLQTVDPFGM